MKVESTGRPAHTRGRAGGVRSGLACLLGLLAVGLLAGCAPGSAQATPEIRTWQTENGARVLFVESPELPMVDLRVVFDAGSARDGDQPGLAALTAGMLTEGAGPWDADTLAERVEGVGAQLGASADRDMATVTLRTLTREPALDTAVDTLAAAIAEPRFAPEDLERLRMNTLVGLRQDRESPGTVASKALMREVFGTHPYAEDPSGTEESVRQLAREDLVDFHRRLYTGANATVAIVGAVDRTTAEALAERAVGRLPRGERPAPVPEVAPLADPADRQIPFPSSQTTVLAGAPGMRRGDPDYFPLYVGNHILGGSGLTSQLMKEVREKRGLTYSAYSYFAPLAQPGPFLMGLKTRNDQADAARQVMIDTLKRFVAAGPTPQELEAAKKNLTGGFPLRIAENKDIVAYLAVIGFYGLPLDYLDRFTGRVEAVTAEQIRDAFARRVQPEGLAVVSVGGGQGGPAIEPETPARETAGGSTAPAGTPAGAEESGAASADAPAAGVPAGAEVGAGGPG